jgi:hypothetical protein
MQKSEIVVEKPLNEQFDEIYNRCVEMLQEELKEQEIKRNEF